MINFKKITLIFSMSMIASFSSVYASEKDVTQENSNSKRKNYRNLENKLIARKSASSADVEISNNEMPAHENYIYQSTASSTRFKSYNKELSNPNSPPPAPPATENNDKVSEEQKLERHPLRHNDGSLCMVYIEKKYNNSK